MRSRILTWVVTAAMAPLLLSACADSSSDTASGDPSPEDSVRSQLESARSALDEAMAENEGLRTRDMTRELLGKYGYDESQAVTVVVGLAQDDYCVYALPTEATSKYGYDADAEVLFTDSADDEIRTVAVADHGQAPDFASGPCSNLGAWSDL